jgi:hypothetical protein
MKKSCWMSTITTLTLLVLATANARLWAQEPAPQIDFYFQRLAVAPILVGHRTPNIDETMDDTLSCTISQICVDDPAIGAEAGPMLTRLVQSSLKNRFGPNVVSMDAVQAAYASLRLDDTKETARSLAQRLGRMLGADLMVVGTVWRYRDRGAIEGFPEKPASVAFALYLVEPRSGRRLWRSIFDETQEYALKNMFKFADRIKMGLKWLSSDELARYGVKETLNAFPDYVIPIQPEKSTEKQEQ